MSKQTNVNIGAIAPLLLAPWAMPRASVLATLSSILHDPAGRACDFAGEDDESAQGYSVVNGVAVIEIVGPITKYPRWWGNSSIEVQRSIEAALADWTVRRIALTLDGPGGTYAGVNELADFINKVSGTGAGQKPISAIISDNAHSAHYWIASQCTGGIWCNRGGFSGCIGVYTVLLDDSKFWEELGVTWELVSSGGVKGLGADGKITPELRADAQREIDDMFGMFTAAVARGRNKSIEEARRLGDGRSWIAQQALELGLIDRIGSVADAMAAIAQEAVTMTAQEFKAHAAANPQAEEVQALVQQGYDKAKAEHKPKPATIAELKAAFPGEDSFVLAQAEAGATMEQANAAAVKDLQTKVKELSASAGQQQQQTNTGRPPVPTGQQQSTQQGGVNPLIADAERRAQAAARR